MKSLMFKEVIVKGTKFENRQKIADLVNPGDILEMRREPENPYDPNAVALLFRGEQVGYIPREIARQIAPLMDEGQKFTAIVKAIYKANPSPGASKIPVVDIFKEEEEKSSSVSYNNEPDPLSLFLEKFCKLEPTLETPKQVLYALYYLWTKRQGEIPISQTKFGILMKKRFGERRQSGGKRYRVWVGIGFKEIKIKKNIEPKILWQLRGLSLAPEVRAKILTQPIFNLHPLED